MANNQHNKGPGFYLVKFPNDGASYLDILENISDEGERFNWMEMGIEEGVPDNWVSEVIGKIDLHDLESHLKT